MAIATTTALTIASVGLSAAGAGMSFGQAAQAGKAARAARADAEKFVTKAREQLSRNAYAAMSLPMQQYEMQREELARAAGQTVDAFGQAERGSAQAATAALMASNQAARDIGAQAAQQMYGLEALQAGEQSKLDQKIADLELEMATGAAKAYRDEMNARTAAMTQGFQQAGQAIATGLTAVSDYDPTRSVVDTSGQGGGGSAPSTQKFGSIEVPSFQAPGAIDRMALAPPPTGLPTGFASALPSAPPALTQSLAQSAVAMGAPLFVPSVAASSIYRPFVGSSSLYPGPAAIPGLTYIPGIGYR